MNINYRYSRNCCCNNKTSPVLEDICDDIKDDIYMYPKYGKDECSCGFDECLEDNGLPLSPILAQTYVPIQKIDKTFTPAVGLKMGTIFPELVRPYVPNQSIMEKEIIKAGNVIGRGCNYGM